MTSTTTRRLRLDRAQLARALNGDPEVVRQFELLLSMVNAIESGGGGTGAVDSVNGQTGVVVLDAGDVGADAAGSAAVVASALSAHEALTDGAHGITTFGASLVSSSNAADARDTLAVPLITSGTAAPSGGSDGDIYLQYV